MTPEERVVALLARRELTEAEQAAVQTLVAVGIDWSGALKIARRQEVVPLIHRSLERLRFPGVPSAVREALVAGRRSVAARNILLVREFARVLRILDTASVPTIPIKGVTLSETLYGDPSLRDCSDIDVLVPRDRAREALQLLRAAGYVAEFSERFFETLLLRGHIEYTLTRREGGFEYVLDLHWGIGWSATNDREAAAALWNDSRTVTRLGIEMRAMSPEWELLTLAVHAARHGWQRLKWLVDVHDYCAGHPIDWRTVGEMAQRFGWLPALRQTLGVCHIMLGTPPPLGVVPAVPARWLPTLLGPPAAETPQALLPFRVIGRRAEKLRYLVRQVLVPTLAERQLIRLPSVLGALYYPIRPVRLGGKWGWRLLRNGGRVFRTL